MPTHKNTVLDLFCGCGGLSKGFEEAGYDILAGVDFDRPALDTFNKNHRSAQGLQLDLSQQDAFDVIDARLGGRALDVIVGGPPCQGFSLTGTRNFDDKRNQLYLAVMELVRRHAPKAFLIENVPGMANLYNGTVRDEIVRRFSEMGYKVSHKVVCAADYGVPQIRKRLVFVGLKESASPYEFPQPYVEAKDYVTSEQAISDLPALADSLGEEVSAYDKSPCNDFQRLMRGDCTVLYNHSSINHRDFVKETIALVPDGGNYKDLPPGVGESRNFHMAWTRLNSKSPARTVDTGHRNLFHYKYNRCPTVRESARIQTFPDDFIFVGTRGQQNRQVGNAVPVLMAKALASQLLEYL